MHKTLLVLNAGSSSLKFALFQMHEELNAPVQFIRGQIEALNTPQAIFSVYHHDGKPLFEPRHLDSLHYNNPGIEQHKWALEILLEWLEKNNHSIAAVGHRVVHGGEDFFAPTVINAKIMQQLKQYIELAPLHQPYNLASIEALTLLQPSLFQVACFDTAFHATQTHTAQAFALPKINSKFAIKRYGFHGLSYEYICQIFPNYLGGKSTGKIVVAHLGNGASLCAIHNGQSVASTMGFTALDGLVMGTRCGNIDPGVILYFLTTLQMSPTEITDLLYHRAGLLGVSGISGDMRTLLMEWQEHKNTQAKQAIDIFLYRFQRELGSLVAALNGIDHLIFTAGIGENATFIREKACLDAKWLGIKIDAQANAKNATQISTPDSAVSVWVIPTNEELMLAQHTWDLLILLYNHHQ